MNAYDLGQMTAREYFSGDDKSWKHPMENAGCIPPFDYDRLKEMSVSLEDAEADYLDGFNDEIFNLLEKDPD